MSYSPTQLVLGRGEVFFDPTFGNTMDPSGEGERYFGNTPSFVITRSVERLATKVSYNGLLHETDGYVVSEEMKLDITTDNISWDNFTSWFSANAPDETTVTGDSYAPFVESMMVKRGRYYQLGAEFGAFGGGFIDNIVVTAQSDSAVLVEGSDYHFDNITGRIFIPLDSPKVYYARGVVCTYMKRDSGSFSIASEAKELNGSLRYVARNQFGPDTSLFFPKVRLSPKGGIEMKSDEFQQMRFEANAMKRSPRDPLLYVYRPGFKPIPITADNSLITADTNKITVDQGSFQ